MSGTAPATATFAAGSSTAELTVATEDDTVVEDASTITATVAAGTGYDVDANASSAAVVVNDNDEATFTVSASPAQIEEGESSTLTVAIANGVTFAADQSIALDLAASTAAAANDYALADGNAASARLPLRADTRGRREHGDGHGDGHRRQRTRAGGDDRDSGLPRRNIHRLYDHRGGCQRRPDGELRGCSDES